MKTKDNTSGTRHVAPSKRPPDSRPQFKPQVAQAKFGAVASAVRFDPVSSKTSRINRTHAASSGSFANERKSSISGPLAYRPQPVPKVLQLKRHEVKKLAQPQNAARSPFITPTPQRILPKSAGLGRPDAHRHQAARNRATQSPAHAPCVQAKTSVSLRNNPMAWPVRKPPSGNILRTSRSIQLAAAPAAAAAAVAVDVEAEEAELKGEVKGSKLSEIAKKLHDVGGGTNQNTTGVARLKGGKLVAYTQLSVEKISEMAAALGIAKVYKTKGAGYHVEVSMYIDHEDDIQAIGASQGFCPHCRQFLTAKKITMDGPMRATNDQVWYSPEFYLKIEKQPKTAPYPWAYERDEVEGRRVTHKTRAGYVVWYKGRTDGAYPPWFKKV